MSLFIVLLVAIIAGLALTFCGAVYSKGELMAMGLCMCGLSALTMAVGILYSSEYLRVVDVEGIIRQEDYIKMVYNDWDNKGLTGVAMTTEMRYATVPDERLRVYAVDGKILGRTFLGKRYEIGAIPVPLKK